MATTQHEQLKAPHTKTGEAWALVVAGAVGLLLMLIFILQNSESAKLNFLWMHGRLPVGAALLLSAVIGALIVIALGAGRLAQHRMLEHRHRRSAGESALKGPTPGWPAEAAGPSSPAPR